MNSQGLRQAILRHALAGKLVPQDPNDEPAAELLKRIAAEREARARVAESTRKRSTPPVVGEGRRSRPKGGRSVRMEV
jgi:type I restriction enzyme S subunit